MKDQRWTDKISNAAQFGGIETSMIDNGPGRGTRIAWINTGTGLRFKVVLDRAMDIADTFYNQHSIAWLSHGGITAREPFSNGGLDWLKTFGGGLLTTCGLSHVGGPESDKYGDRGLHGQISNLAADVESIIQPDPFSGRMQMSITGRMKETQVLGPNLELKRTISATLGEATIQINDEVINRGNGLAPHMMLYHFNFGWPLVDEGTDLIWNGQWQTREGATGKIFKEGNNFRKCPAPLADHKGTGEEVAMVDMDADTEGCCTCGLYNSELGLALSLQFQKAQLPWMINWQHWGRGEYVTGLEPATNPLIGQAMARERKELIFLEPGETRKYQIQLQVLTVETEIRRFLENNK
ncbi:MAG: aldose 1-epimerase family protein [Bacteroidota bacterium]|nr:aldose 1-epimerase family protein [Bacteroidota bacterium]